MDFILGVQERRAQFEHGVQCQYGGSSRILAWDPVTVVFDNSTTDTAEIVSFLFLEFTLGMLRFSFLKDWYFEGLIVFV
jgi:hypothetical protein